MKKSFFKVIYDFLGIPLRLIVLPDRACEKIGLTSLQEERIYNVLPHIQGRLLDIGCGDNRLVKIYKNGIGADVHKWTEGVVVVEDTTRLPFGDRTFDTITFIASLNHIPYRKDVLREARRLLKPVGRLIITMINPFLGAVGHALWWYSEDKHRGGMRKGETVGLSAREIIKLCSNEGFKLKGHKRFLYGMNNIYIFEH